MVLNDCCHLDCKVVAKRELSPGVWVYEINRTLDELAKRFKRSFTYLPFVPKKSYIKGQVYSDMISEGNKLSVAFQQVHGSNTYEVDEIVGYLVVPNATTESDIIAPYVINW